METTEEIRPGHKDYDHHLHTAAEETVNCPDGSGEDDLSHAITTDGKKVYLDPTRWCQALLVAAARRLHPDAFARLDPVTDRFTNNLEQHLVWAIAQLYSDRLWTHSGTDLHLRDYGSQANGRLELSHPEWEPWGRVKAYQRYTPVSSRRVLQVPPGTELWLEGDKGADCWPGPLKVLVCQTEDDPRGRKYKVLIPPTAEFGRSKT